jgi:hypothetical protein
MEKAEENMELVGFMVYGFLFRVVKEHFGLKFSGIPY